MRGRVVTGGYEYLAVETVVCRHHVIGDANELLSNRAQQVQTGLDLGLGIFRLHCGGDHSYEPAFRCDLMGVRHQGHVDVGIAANLRASKFNTVLSCRNFCYMCVCV